MAKKEQCERCSKCKHNSYGLKCTEYGKEPAFDEMDCFHFSEYKAQSNEHNIDLSKKIKNEDNESVVPHREEHVHGWLSFALIMIVLGGITSFVYSIVTANDDSGLLYGLSIIEGVLYFGLAVYAAVQVYNKKPDGIFLMKAYIVGCFLSNLLGVLLFDNSQADILYNQTRMIRSTIWSVIWFSFLTFSPQVKRLFPKGKRRLFLRDKIIVGFFFAYPVILFLIGMLLGVTKPSLVYGEDLERYVEKVNTFEYHNGTSLYYDKKENQLLIKQILSIDTPYANNPDYIQTIKTAGEKLSKSTSAMMALETMMGYDSLIYYADATQANILTYNVLPNGDDLFGAWIEYKDFKNIDNNTKYIYSLEMYAFETSITNALCPIQIDEGLYCDSILFNHFSSEVKYKYRLTTIPYRWSYMDYLDLINILKESIDAETPKELGLSMYFKIVDVSNNTLIEKTFSPETL